LQIEDYENERNPYYHTAQDTIAHMNLDYWEEQMKTTVAVAAHLAVPVSFTPADWIYLPMIVKAGAGTWEEPARCNDQH